VKREGDDTEAINKLFAPEFRNRLDAVISFSHLPRDVVSKVVDKFVLQLEAQLADRNVTIELSDEAREWLVENGYDETMGARPMARLIQTTIKTPLADEVLFGRLKGGGAVRVIVHEEDGRPVLGFDFPEGPVTPKPEKDVADAAKKRARRRTMKAKKPAAKRKPPKSDGGNFGGMLPGRGPSTIRTVPKVPLSRS
jgi:ATP-dependent Clp protease ATP-binding subunit ClpA